jgi:hypothetical protein
LEVWQNLAPFSSRPIGVAVEVLLTKVVNWQSSVLPIVVCFVSVTVTSISRPNGYSQRDALRVLFISALPTESLILSARAESILLSACSAKQQSTKSYSGKCSKDGGGRGNRGGGDRFDNGSSGNNCSDNSNRVGNGDGDSGNGDSGNDDSNSDTGDGNSNSGRKNNNQQNAAAKKEVTAVNALAS